MSYIFGGNYCPSMQNVDWWSPSTVQKWTRRESYVDRLRHAQAWRPRLREGHLRLWFSTIVINSHKLNSFGMESVHHFSWKKQTNKRFILLKKTRFILLVGISKNWIHVGGCRNRPRKLNVDAIFVKCLLWPDFRQQNLTYLSITDLSFGQNASKERKSSEKLAASQSYFQRTQANSSEGNRTLSQCPRHFSIVCLWIHTNRNKPSPNVRNKKPVRKQMFHYISQKGETIL